MSAPRTPAGPAPHDIADHADRIRAKIIEVRADLAKARKEKAYTAVSTLSRLEVLCLKELNAIEAGRDTEDPFANLEPDEVASELVEILRKLPGPQRTRVLESFGGPRLASGGSR